MPGQASAELGIVDHRIIGLVPAFIIHRIIHVRLDILEGCPPVNSGSVSGKVNFLQRTAVAESLLVNQDDICRDGDRPQRCAVKEGLLINPLQTVGQIDRSEAGAALKGRLVDRLDIARDINVIQRRAVPESRRADRRVHTIRQRERKLHGDEIGTVLERICINLSDSFSNDERLDLGTSLANGVLARVIHITGYIPREKAPLIHPSDCTLAVDDQLAVRVQHKLRIGSAAGAASAGRLDGSRRGRSREQRQAQHQCKHQCKHLTCGFHCKNHSFFCPNCGDYKKVTGSHRNVTLL